MRRGDPSRPRRSDRPRRAGESRTEGRACARAREPDAPSPREPSRSSSAPRTSASTQLYAAATTTQTPNLATRRERTARGRSPRPRTPAVTAAAAAASTPATPSTRRATWGATSHPPSPGSTSRPRLIPPRRRMGSTLASQPRADPASFPTRSRPRIQRRARSRTPPAGPAAGPRRRSPMRPTRRRWAETRQCLTTISTTGLDLKAATTATTPTRFSGRRPRPSRLRCSSTEATIR